MHQGELSAARQALTASPLAPGTAATLAQLRDPTRRPTEPYTPLQANIDQFVPEQPLQLPAHKLLTALRRSRKGAAPGPSGLTADTLRLVLDDEATTTLFVEVCQHLAQARVPPNIAQAIGLGRMVALTKPNAASQALLDSQTGPFASRAFTTIPHTTDTTYPDHIFRILLLRRLRLPLPLTERACRCRRNLDPLGDH